MVLVAGLVATVALTSPAAPNVSNLLQRVSRGEVVEELLHVDDPELDRYLTAALKVPGYVAQHDNCPWILQLAAKKLGDNAVGPLLELTEAAGADDGRGDFIAIRSGSPFTDGQVAEFAGDALALVVRPEHVPMLLKITLGPDEARAKTVATAGFSAARPVREAFTCRYLEAVTTKRRKQLRTVRGEALWSHPLSKDVTGELLRVYKTSPPRREPYGYDDFIAIGPGPYFVVMGPCTGGVHALGQIGNDAAVDALLRLAFFANEDVCREAIHALKCAKSRRAIPRLRELLDDTSESGWADARVCDLAAAVLAKIVPNGPKVTPLNDTPERRDEVVAEWKTICDKMKSP